MRRAASLVALVAALVLAGCQSGQDPTIEAGGPPEATSAGAFSPPAKPPITAPATDQRAHLVSVKADATAGGGTRVIFEFDPVVPGYTIDYVERPVTEDGSGDEVAVLGDAVLTVRMENASAARIDGEKVTRTYTGPERVVAGGTPSAVIEAVGVGDFEGVLTWALGLRQRAETISVSTLSGPSRLVLDVPGPSAG